jgi:chromosomal replication initiation ATPase DnaA
MGTSLKRETTSEKTSEKKESFSPRTSFTPQDWQQVLTELRGQMSQATFDANLRGTQLIGRQGNCLTLQTPSVLAAERLNQQLRPLIERALADYTGCPYQILAQAVSSQAQPARPPA